jgi:cytochrome P450
MTRTEPPAVRLTRYLDVVGALTDPRCVVPSPPRVESTERGIGWLRASVSRFSTGATHARHRGLAEAALSHIDLTDLRRLAGTWPEVAPAGVLARAMGIVDSVEGVVEGIARAYFPGTDGGADADRAVDELVTILSGRFDEATAAMIGILVQAHEATASLVAKTLSAYLHTDAPVDAMLAETLRHDPPVRLMRRVCVAPYQDHSPGTLLELDIAAANRDPDTFAEPDLFRPDRPDAHRHLTFGTGLRPCPGRDHAVAIAAGIVEARIAT